jgi:hypothetical protein
VGIIFYFISLLSAPTYSTTQLREYSDRERKDVKMQYLGIRSNLLFHEEKDLTQVSVDPSEEKRTNCPYLYV